MGIFIIGCVGAVIGVVIAAMFKIAEDADARNRIDDTDIPEPTGRTAGSAAAVKYDAQFGDATFGAELPEPYRSDKQV